MVLLAGSVIDTTVGVVTALGVMVAASQFVVELRRVRRDRDERVFKDVNDSYLQYLSLVVEHGELAAFEVEGPDRQTSNLALWEMLFTVAERAYVLYQADLGPGDDGSFRSRQWKGWSDWLERWAERPDFREAWEHLRGSSENDSTFGAFVERLVRLHDVPETRSSAD